MQRGWTSVRESKKRGGETLQRGLGGTWAQAAEHSANEVSRPLVHNLQEPSNDPKTQEPWSGNPVLFIHIKISASGVLLEILATQALNKKMSQRILRLTTRRIQNGSKQRDVKMS